MRPSERLDSDYAARDQHDTLLHCSINNDNNALLGSSHFATTSRMIAYHLLEKPRYKQLNVLSFIVTYVRQ